MAGSGRFRPAQRAAAHTPSAAKTLDLRPRPPTCPPTRSRRGRRRGRDLEGSLPIAATGAPRGSPDRGSRRIAAIAAIGQPGFRNFSITQAARQCARPSGPPSVMAGHSTRLRMLESNICPRDLTSRHRNPTFTTHTVFRNFRGADGLGMPSPVMPGSTSAIAHPNRYARRAGGIQVRRSLWKPRESLVVLSSVLRRACP